MAGYRQLEKAYRDGKVRSIGISNFEGKYLEELKQQYRGQLIGQYIESFEDHERTLTEEKALQYGLEALLAGLKETGQTGARP